MTTFDNREQAYENKFAHDAEVQFRILARRNKLLGLWAARHMNLTADEAESYAKAVVQAEFEEAGDEDVVRKVLGDLTTHGLQMDDASVRQAMEGCLAEARRQISES